MATLQKRMENKPQRGTGVMKDTLPQTASVSSKKKSGAKLAEFHSKGLSSHFKDAV